MQNLIGFIGACLMAAALICFVVTVFGTLNDYNNDYPPRLFKATVVTGLLGWAVMSWSAA